MEFITTTSLAYGCMGLCCEMLNLVVLGQILWFRCWFSVMKIGRGKPFFDKKNHPYIFISLAISRSRCYIGPSDLTSRSVLSDFIFLS